MPDLHTTSPSTLNNKIMVLNISIIVGLLLAMAMGIWLAQYISILAVVVATGSFYFYANWATDKISHYNWLLEIIDREKRRIWSR